MPQFDARAFILDNFRHHSRIGPFLKSYGVSAPDETTIEKWYYRSSIPSIWLVVLLVALEWENGRPVSLAPYLTLPGG